MKDQAKYMGKRLLQLFRFPRPGRSYSQFAEDRVLACLMMAEAYRERRVGIWKSWIGDSMLPRVGAYVDIGANEPIRFSNSYFFYRLGWSGICIDPTPGMKRSFDLVRPRDQNLELAVGTVPGTQTYYSWGAGCVVNTFDPRHAERWASEFGRSPQKIPVGVERLASILEGHLSGSPIDFFSVDCEGVDLDVLRSNDWDRFRPRWVLVELHEDSPVALLDSDLVHFMKGVGYRIVAWPRPSVVFARMDDLEWSP